MRPIIFLSAFLLLFTQAFGQARAGEWKGRGFSADMIATDAENPGGEISGKLYIDTPGLRMEMVEEGESAITIFRFGEDTMYVLMPALKKYMEIPLQAQGGGPAGLTSLYSGDVCADFEEGKKLGRETVAGRRAEKWRCDGPLDEYTSGGVYRWFDKRLGFVLRQDDDDGSRMELRNITEGRQTASLFKPPAGYEKFAMPTMPGTAITAQPGIAAGEPFAEKVTIPGTAPTDELANAEFQLGAMVVRAARVPGKNAVGVPAYPGARVVQTTEQSTGSINGVSFEGLPMVILLSEDTPEKIVAFYRAALPDWQYENLFFTDWFWSGGGEFHPLEISGMETPAIGIFELGEIMKYKIWPEAKTRIDFRYQPN